MASFRELLAADQGSASARSSPSDAEARLGEATFLDVREQDEYEQGTIPGSVFIPRGHLESQVETKLPDQRRARSSSTAPAATAPRSRPRRSQELGYTDVVSMAGGFGRWKNEGRPWITPAGAHRRAAQPLQPPHPAPRGRRGRPAEAARVARCCCSAPAASAHPPRSTSRPRASARSASSTWTSSTRRTCSARSSTTWTASASARSTRRRRRSPQLNPDVDVVTYDVRFGADNVLDIIDGYDVDRRRHRQLPDALPAQRRVAAEAHPGRARLDLPLRGSGHGVQAVRRARATAACSPSRRRPSSRRAARRPACSACCPASSARSRRSRRSSCSSTSATRSSAGCSPTTRSSSRSAPSRCGATRRARRAATNAAPIVIAEYDEHCLPHAVLADGSVAHALIRRQRRSRATSWSTRAASSSGSRTTTANDPASMVTTRSSASLLPLPTRTREHAVAELLDLGVAPTERVAHRVRRTRRRRAARSTASASCGSTRRRTRPRRHRGARAARTARPPAAAARAGRAGTCASRRGGRPTPRGTTGARSTRAGGARPGGSTRRRRGGGSRSGPARGRDTPSASTASASASTVGAAAPLQRHDVASAPRAPVAAAGRAAPARAWPARASAVSSMPSIDAPAAGAQPDRDGDGLVVVEQQRRQVRAGGEAVAAGGPGRGVDRVAERPEPVDVAAEGAGAHAEALGELRARPEPVGLQQREEQQRPFGRVSRRPWHPSPLDEFRPSPRSGHPREIPRDCGQDLTAVIRRLDAMQTTTDTRRGPPGTADDRPRRRPTEPRRRAIAPEGLARTFGDVTAVDRPRPHHPREARSTASSARTAPASRPR